MSEREARKVDAVEMEEARAGTELGEVPVGQGSSAAARWWRAGQLT